MTVSRTGYVVGFLMDQYNVVLVEKKRPDWQAGMLNGVGGKVEADEDPYAAMVREFHEEAGLLIPDWELFLDMHCANGVRIEFFRCHVSWQVLNKVHSCTDEKITVEMMRGLPFLKTIPNLQWIIPLANYRQDSFEPVVFTEVPA